MGVYVPPFRVRLEEWCAWTGNDWSKVQHVVGRSFRVPGPHENVYTMAANAVLRLLRQNEIDPRQIGFLGLGTESSTDNAAGAVIVRGMVDQALGRMGLPKLSRNLEVPEFKHACLGGIYALKAASRYVALDGGGRAAIVVSADIAEYERGSSGEQTQGAGAVAMLVEQTPRLFGVDLSRTGSASDYRGVDFRKPIGRHFIDGYAPRTQRLHDFPIFNGKYSVQAYLDEIAEAFDEMVARLNTTPIRVFNDMRAIFFHRPYHLMAVQGLAFLYVRALARMDDARAELHDLCAEAGVEIDDVLREATSPSGLQVDAGTSVGSEDVARATNAAASLLRKRAHFQQLLRDKMGLGSNAMRDLGNLYAAALPAWLAAALEEAVESGCLAAGAQMLAVGYGSGDAAESIPLRLASGWESAASKIGIADALGKPLDLDQELYEELHDRRRIPDALYVPRDEFAIARVGTLYRSDFQDLGIEYYEYVA
jgi:hydroxymethylglutaryl-CoA synthase